MDTTDENNKESGPEEIKRAIGGMLREGSSQAEIHELMDKINQTYEESAQPPTVDQELADAIQDKEIVLQRKLTQEEIDQVRDEINKQKP